MIDERFRVRRMILKSVLGGGAAVVAGRAGVDLPIGAVAHAQESVPAGVGPAALVASGVKVGKELYRAGEFVQGEITLNSPRTDLRVEALWTDSYGRLAGRGRALPARGLYNTVSFSLPLTGPLTYVNRVLVLVDGVLQREDARFLVSPAPDGWDDYHVINYTAYPHGYYEKLREAGVDAVLTYRDHMHTAFLDNNFRFFVEEMNWETLATYHKNFTLWKELVGAFMKNRNDWKLLVRDPCFTDPKTFQYASEQLTQLVNKYKEFRPLYYSLADELGIGDQIAPLDLCHSDTCISGFAQYLKKIYKSIHEHRHEWDVDYYHWDDEQIAQGAKFNWDDLMMRETTTDRAMDRILMDHLRHTYKTVADFNRAWGVSFPAASGPSEYAMMDWSPVVAPLADTRSLLTLDDKSLDALFGSLEAANAAWGQKGGWTTDRKPTKFKTWAEVAAYVRRLEKTLDELDSTEHWNLAAWCDFRNYMDLTMADFVRRSRDVCHALDPHARAGIEGGQSPWAFGWYNYENVCEAVDVIEPYNIGNNVEIIRGIGNHRLIQLNTYGFQHTPGAKAADLTEKDRLAQRQTQRKVWWQLFHESRGSIIWDYTEKDYRFIDPARELTPAAETFKDTFREIRSGIGKLIIAAHRTHDGVAVHYSHPSVQVHWMIENIKVGKRWPLDEVGFGSLRFNGVRNSTTKLIEDQNLQFEFVGSRQMVDGILNDSSFQALFLPQSIAVSANEAARIRDFVEGGGTVIADCRTATMNEHGRDLGTGQLDDLFGINRRRSKRAVAGRPRGVADFRDLKLNGKSWDLQIAEPQLGVTNGARALAQQGDVPAVIVREIGKGLAVYLNLELFPYQHQRVRPGPETSTRELIGGILAEAGVRPRVRILDAQGDFAVPAVEVVQYELGAQKIVAVFRNAQMDPGGWVDGPKVNARGWGEDIDNSALEQPLEVTVKLPEGHHVYDVRQARALGQTTSVRATLDPWSPLVLTLSPTQAKELRLSAPPRAEPGRQASCEVIWDDAAPSSQTRIVRLNVFAPGGQQVDHYSGNLRLAGMRGKVNIPFAWNDPIGTWRVQARDVATGLTAEQNIQFGSG